MSHVVDTSLLYAAFDAQDRRQAAARKALADASVIDVPREVVAELLGLVHRRAGFPAARAIWETLVRLPNLQFGPPAPLDAVAKIFQEGAGRLSWVDAAVVASCRARSWAPLAFDDDLHRAVKG